MEDKKQKKMGVPTKLTPKKAEKACEMAKKGATHPEVAEVLGVSEKTIYNWQRNNEDFLLAYREARAHANEAVEAALFKKATGYKKKIEKSAWSKERDDFVKDITEVEVEPDVNAIKFFLTNRDPDRWKEKSEVKTENEIKTITENPAEQLQRIKDMLKDDVK